MILIAFFLLCLSLLFSFYFSGTEAGFLALNKEKYDADCERHQSSAVRLKTFIDKPEEFLGLTLIGNNLSNVIAAQAGLPVFLLLFSVKTDLTETLANFITVVVLFMFTEALPKIIFKTYSNQALYLTSNVLLFFRFLFYPFVSLVIFLSNVILKFLPLKANGENDSNGGTGKLSRKDFSNIISNSYQDGLLNQEEIHFFKIVSSLSRIKAVEVMQPLANLLVIHKFEDVSIGMEQFKKIKCDFVPVCDKRIDNIVGYINIIDVFNSTKKRKIAKDFLIETSYIPETNTVDKAYETIADSPNHVLTVVDEYGGCSGILLETDIIDRIFGFQYNLDTQRQSEFIKKIDSRSYEINTSFDIDDFNNKFKTKLPKHGYETLGGFINHYFKYVPNEGEILFFENIQIMVVKSNNVKVDTVHVTFKKIDDRKNNKKRKTNVQSKN